MSKLYLVTYVLKDSSEAAAFEEELKTASKWWHFIENTWIVQTDDSTANKIWGRLSKAYSFGAGDRLLVIEILPTASRQGWLPKRAWEWLKARGSED
jgi:hypothetical protein